MKRFLSFLCIFFIAQSCFADSPIAINKNLQISSVSKHDEDPRSYYVINIKYPQITGKSLSKEASNFNQLILNLVNTNLEQFKTSLKADQLHIKNLPENLRQNELNIDYVVDVVKPRDTILVVVRLSITTQHAGRPHVYHQHQVLNFDLTEGKELSLNDIFKLHSNYLKKLSKYTIKELSQALKDKWMIKDGAGPDERNFRAWNIQKDGILLTFDDYQVSPNDGTHEVIIPYDVLKSSIAKDAPIQACVENAINCV